MPTLTLQCVSALLTVLFAAAALSVSRHAIAPDRRAGWRLAGAGCRPGQASAPHLHLRP